MVKESPDIVEKKEWHKLPWDDLYKSIDAPVAVITNERGLILAEVFSEEQADAIIADHTTAALVPRLLAALREINDSATTIVGGLREGWWGTGSGELEEGELQQAEDAIDHAALVLAQAEAAQQGETA